MRPPAVPILAPLTIPALGHPCGPNAERGVFRTRNGGRSWQKVLFRSQRAGAVDLCLDPRDPRVLYAAVREIHRTPWLLWSGGPGSDGRGVCRLIDLQPGTDVITAEPQGFARVERPGVEVRPALNLEVDVIILRLAVHRMIGLSPPLVSTSMDRRDRGSGAGIPESGCREALLYPDARILTPESWGWLS